MPQASTSGHSIGVEHHSADVHRNLKQELTTYEAFFILIKSCLGIGGVMLPNAFKYSGLVTGAICVLFISITSLYLLSSVTTWMRVISNRKGVHHTTYPLTLADAIENGPPSLRCWKTFVKVVTYALLVMYHFNICSIYVILIAESGRQVLYETTNIEVDLRFFIIAVGIVLVFNFSRTAINSFMALTIGSTLLQLCTLGACFYFAINRPDVNAPKSLSTMDYQYLPLAYGIMILAALEGIGVVFVIEGKCPKLFGSTYGILRLGVTIVIIINLATGIIGYWAYGDDVKLSLLMSLPSDDVFAELTKIGYGMSYFEAYNLHGYVVMDIIWTRFIKTYCDDYNYEPYEFAMRLCTSISTFIVASLLLSYSHIIPLLSAILLSILGISFPALLNICLHYHTGYGRCRIILILNLIFMFLGFLGALSGGYMAWVCCRIHYLENVRVSNYFTVTA